MNQRPLGYELPQPPQNTGFYEPPACRSWHLAAGNATPAQPEKRGDAPSPTRTFQVGRSRLAAARAALEGDEGNIVVHIRVHIPAVPVKNSIQPTVTECERHGDTLADRVGAQPSSLTIGSRDDPRPRCLGLRPRPPRQLNRCRAGECRPPSSTGGAATISWPAPAPLPGPALLGWALTAVGRVAGHPPHCPTRDRPRLAPGRLPALLALEVPAPLSGSPAARS